MRWYSPNTYELFLCFALPSLLATVLELSRVVRLHVCDCKSSDLVQIRLIVAPHAFYEQACVDRNATIRRNDWRQSLPLLKVPSIERSNSELADHEAASIPVPGPAAQCF